MPKWINDRRQAAREKAIERYKLADPDTPIKFDFNEMEWEDIWREIKNGWRQPFPLPTGPEMRTMMHRCGNNYKYRGFWAIEEKMLEQAARSDFHLMYDKHGKPRPAYLRFWNNNRNGQLYNLFHKYYPNMAHLKGYQGD